MRKIISFTVLALFAVSIGCADKPVIKKVEKKPVIKKKERKERDRNRFKFLDDNRSDTESKANATTKRAVATVSPDKVLDKGLKSVATAIAQNKLRFAAETMDALSTEGVSGSGDVFQIERRSDETKPLGDVFQCVECLVEPVSVRAVELAIANRRCVDARQSS